MIKYFCNICNKQLQFDDWGRPDCIEFHVIEYARRNYQGGLTGHLCKRCSRVLFNYPYEKKEIEDAK